MEKNESNWKLGEIVNLPRTERKLEDGITNYVNYIESRYICVREATDGQRGILVKVLGKAHRDHVKVIGGRPFCKDDREELFIGRHYYSFPFPSASDVQEVLEILKWNESLVDKFEDARMHINPNSMFWVSETVRNAFLKKTPQVYVASSGQLQNPSGDTNYYRITMVYFYKGQLIW